MQMGYGVCRQTIGLADDHGTTALHTDRWTGKYALIAPYPGCAVRQYFLISFALNDVVFILSLASPGWSQRGRNFQRHGEEGER